MGEYRGPCEKCGSMTRCKTQPVLCPDHQPSVSLTETSATVPASPMTRGSIVRVMACDALDVFKDFGAASRALVKRIASKPFEVFISLVLAAFFVDIYLVSVGAPAWSLLVAPDIILGTAIGYGLVYWIKSAKERLK